MSDIGEKLKHDATTDPLREEHLLRIKAHLLEISRLCNADFMFPLLINVKPDVDVLMVKVDRHLKQIKTHKK